MRNMTISNQLIQLPSGVSVNLSQVSRIVPVGDTLEVHFTGGDRAVLAGEDAEAFRRRSAFGGPLSSTAKTVIFWVIIVLAICLVYSAVRR